ncbi:Morn repeat incomplete domain containing protein [Pandoravirus macleodensis]|uniref:Morn repeat incomplete domain containing protein n=1 Tax=Pandoravirus macleodensis TaxID=2107707 RepID=A0A2U7UEB5_9VIRU|nr:Morn repeat incomplete domain containing protein [Pandoravirus macleodensis]AVK76808.1 Morn repeat incomplete domain containing protein [Pandoravirus macleodensis]UMO79382.1 Morn repeat incomplete domain containing protein [Pandoravirus aubagnensis]
MSDADAYLSLDHMPSEIIWSIARYLMADATIGGFVDTWYLATTCRALSAALLDDDAMWASHVRLSFPEPFCSMHSDPHAFGERWMRVYARLTRLAGQDHGDGNAVRVRQETGLVYVPVRPCGAPQRSTTILQDTVYESALVTKSLLACGKIVNDQLEGYGVLCAAQHNTRDDGTRDTGASSHIPVVLLEGVFRGDRLHGRGILRRERYAPARDEVHDACKHKRRQAIYTPTKFSALCRCTECMGTLFVQNVPDGPYKYNNRLNSFSRVLCIHANWFGRCAQHEGQPYCCQCAARWCPKCRLRYCRQECTDPARACASCTTHLHARAAKHFLARLDTFDGMWDDGMPHGNGKAVFEHGTRYDGPWHRGLPHGRGLVDGVERQWFMGTLLPRARLEYPTANSTVSVYEGDVKPRGLSVGSLSSMESVPHLDDANCSSTLARLSWKDYARHGHGTMRYANGSVFEGEWIGDARHRGRMFHPSGPVFDGAWEKDGSGFGTVSWPDGRIDTGALWDAMGRVQLQ